MPLLFFYYSYVHVKTEAKFIFHFLESSSSLSR